MEDITPISEPIENQLGASQELGKDDFLKLMVTQLQNQDPLNPTTNEDFLAQLAQFSALEQMNNLNDSFSVLADSLKISNAASLLGTEVNYIADPEAGSREKGNVDHITIKENQIFISVNGKEIPLTNIYSINAVKNNSQNTDIAD